MRSTSHLVVFFLFPFLLIFAGCGDDDDSSTSTGQTAEDDDETPADDDDASPNDDDSSSDDDDTAWDGLRVGMARVDVTPEHSVMMGGYGTYFFNENLCRWSQGVHDPLYATAAAFDDGEAPPVILIVADMVGLVITDVEVIQATLGQQLDIDPERVIVAATHNHQSPDTVGIWGVILPPVSGRDETYIDQLIDGCVRAGAEAYANRRPAIVRAASGQTSDYHYNAQWTVDPNAPLDSTMTMLAFREPGGPVIGTLMNWACHPMIMGPQNNQLSADFVGPYYRLMDQEAGGINMFVNGNLGAGVHPQNEEHEIDYTGRTWGTWDLVEFWGRGLADEAQALLLDSTVIEDTAISLNHLTVEGTLQNIFFALVGRLGLIPREMPPLGQAGTTKVTAWRIGPLSFATAPGEVSPRVGLQLRARMDGQYRIVVNIGQDWLGYIMTANEYRNLLYIYFSILSVGPEMGDAVIGAYEQLFSTF